jgi:hypothetical protein
VTDDVGQTRVVLYRGDAEVANWPLEPRDHLDVATVDELARLQLVAGRLGFTVRLRHADANLRELLGLTGLDGVVPVIGCPQPSVEVGGEPEGGEQRRVEEVVVPDDPVP